MEHGQPKTHKTLIYGASATLIAVTIGFVFIFTYVFFVKNQVQVNLQMYESSLKQVNSNLTRVATKMAASIEFFEEILRTKFPELFTN